MVSGKVSDISGKDITGASITSGGKGTQTDAGGIYSLSLPRSSATESVTSVGFAIAGKQ